jgi:hypothetical protein
VSLRGNMMGIGGSSSVGNQGFAWIVGAALTSAVGGDGYGGNNVGDVAAYLRR